MKNQKGFISITILISIILGVLVVSGGTYLGVKKYEQYKENKTSDEQRKNNLTNAQGKALEDAQIEIEKLKLANELTKKEQEALENKISKTPKNSGGGDITALELSPFLSGVVKIDCGEFTGTGVLWEINKNDPMVLTNQHVVNDTTFLNSGYCKVLIPNSTLFYKVKPILNQKITNATDFVFLSLEKGNQSDTSKPNVSISNMRKCSENMPAGSPVVVIGYPAYAQNEVDTQIITNGIVSGYVPQALSLPNQNYYISAKTDSGNSGGIAFSKDGNGLCALGIPTWLTFGHYETQGVIQNIRNIFIK